MISQGLKTGLLALLCCASIQAGADEKPLDPESYLARIQMLQSSGQSAEALSTANKLVERYPTFNLGHLIRADILLSRAQRIQTLGAYPDSDKQTERLNELRLEAKNRFKAIYDRELASKAPDLIINLAQSTTHVIVVDASQSRLYLLRNQGGTPSLENSYYTSIGKFGFDKQLAGDQKTPLGVYKITSNIPGSKLTDFYGKGALTLNYPNNWDTRNGRTGYGIWLHGVPSQQYNRAPQASNGCVVLANPDMASLLGRVAVGTQVIITSHINWLPTDQWKQSRDQFMAQFRPDRAALDLNVQQTASIFRYPEQTNMIQLSLTASAQKTAPAKRQANQPTQSDQYWQLDSGVWKLL